MKLLLWRSSVLRTGLSQWVTLVLEERPKEPKEKESKIKCVDYYAQYYWILCASGEGELLGD